MTEKELVRDFTWPELLEYNISFLKGEKQGTFYHGGPLLSDQVPEDLIALQNLGIFTDNGQGTQTERGLTPQGNPYLEEQRAYLDAYLPLSIAAQVLHGARRDPEVVFEITLIRTGKQIYVSDELVTSWARDRKGFSLTKDKEAASDEELKDEPWRYFTNMIGPGVDGFKYSMMNAKTFTQWNEWVEDGLCFLFIADKEYGQEPKSMPARILGYLAKTGGTRRTKKVKHKSRNRKMRRTRYLFKDNR